MLVAIRSPFACLGILLAALPCAAQIDDRAGLFKPETIEKANERIREIRDGKDKKQGTGKDIAVLTLKQVPEDLAKSYNLEDAGQRKEVFARIATEHMEKLGRKSSKGTFEGVHLLICQEPRHIEVTVSDDTEKLFGPWYRNHLKGRMIGKFQPDNPDQNVLQTLRNKLRTGPAPDTGLQEAVGYVGDKLDYNRPVDQTNLYVGLAVMAAMIGAGVILSLLRMHLRKKTPADAGVYEADDSGRSIGVLGGGIGAVCGQWFYNRYFGPPTEPASIPAAGSKLDATSEEFQGPDALPGSDSVQP